MASFSQYAGVVSRSCLEKAVALWGHLATVMSCQNRATSGWWRSYDVSLRHSYSSMKQADFLLNQCLFTQGGELGVAPAPDTSSALAFGSSEEAEEKEGTGLLLLERRQVLCISAVPFLILLCPVLWGSCQEVLPYCIRSAAWGGESA